MRNARSFAKPMVPGHGPCPLVPSPGPGPLVPVPWSRALGPVPWSRALGPGPKGPGPWAQGSQGAQVASESTP